MIIEGATRGWTSAGPPDAGTDEVQTLTIDASGGTFRLAFQGFVTEPIEWTSTNNDLRDAVDAALEALPSIGAGGVTVAVGTMTDGVGTLTITFGGNLTKLAVPLIEIADDSLEGESTTLEIAETTPGKTATGRGAPKGALLVDTTNGVLYINQGTPLAPDWAEIAIEEAE